MDSSKNRSDRIKIALIGLGQAGQARLKALLGISGMELAGIVSRRKNIGTKAWDNVLRDTEIHAVAISTENDDHASRVQEALEAGKHVLCDYPLALSVQDLKRLQILSQQKSKILHIEHINLLTDSHKLLKQETQCLGTFKEGAYTFQAGWNDDPSPQFLAYASFMQIMDVMGCFEIADSKIQKSDKRMTMEADLIFPSSGRLKFLMIRERGLERVRSFKAQFEKGDYNWSPQREVGGLFLKDLEYFEKRIRGEIDVPYYHEEDVVRVTELLSGLMT